jgi:hypothetical protein
VATFADTTPTGVAPLVADNVAALTTEDSIEGGKE